MSWHGDEQRLQQGRPTTGAVAEGDGSRGRGGQGGQGQGGLQHGVQGGRWHGEKMAGVEKISSLPGL